MDASIVINSKTGCPFCVEAKAFLTTAGVPFVERVLDDEDERQALYDALGLIGKQRTVPQVMLTVEGETYRIGGAARLRMQGVLGLRSLFEPLKALIDLPRATVVAVTAAAASEMVMAEEGHSCCE